MVRRLGFTPVPQSSNETNDSWLNDASKRALLVLLTALMFHSRLEEGGESIFPAGAKPKPLRDCLLARDLVSELSATWHKILEVNYAPIFEPALAVLTSATRDHRLAHAMRTIVEAARQTKDDVASIRHDLLGRIFHKTLTNPEFDGSFYTTTPAAVLLAGLALQPNSLLNDVHLMRIVDPACGTGSLLIASVERLRELSDPALFDYDQAIESVVSGFDINRAAAHMAAVTLGLLSPTTSFSNMNIYLAAFGVQRNETSSVRAGSLELFAEEGQLPFDEFPNSRSHISSDELPGRIEPADLVIMNPPFTRNSLRHDQLPQSVELKVKQREKQIFDKYKDIVQFVSSGPPFVLLGDYLLKKDSGTLALLLPLVSSINPSTKELRKWLAKRFYVDLIVASHDPKRFWFSENTSISEMLLILRRKRPGSDEAKSTRVLNLAANPDSVKKADRLLSNIDGDQFENIHGTVVEWPSERVLQGDWRAVQFLRDDVTLLSREIEDSTHFDVQALGEIADIHSTYRSAREQFKIVETPDVNTRRALWHFKSEITSTMQASTDVNIAVKNDEDAATRVWDRRSHLLLPIRLQTSLARVSVVYCDIPTIGSYWMNVRFHDNDDAMQKALCVWLNSTFGFVSLLAVRTPNTPCYPSFSLDWLKKLAVPRFTSSQSNDLVRVFEQFSTIDLGRWSEHENPHRVKFDTEVAEIAHLDNEFVSKTRRSLAREPICTNQQSIYELVRSINR